MQYKVTQQYQRGSEQLAKTFVRAEDAWVYIKAQAEAQAAMKIQVIYRLYDFDDIIGELDSSTYKPEASAPDAGSASGAAGKGNQEVFRPSPLATAPRPSGMPQNWRKPEDDKDKNK